MSNELDKHFGEQLRGYESELDAEALWQAVKPPRRSRWGWWILLIFLVGLGGTAYWWMSREAYSPSGAAMTAKETPASERVTTPELSRPEGMPDTKDVEPPVTITESKLGGQIPKASGRTPSVASTSLTSRTTPNSPLITKRLEVEKGTKTSGMHLAERLEPTASTTTQDEVAAPATTSPVTAMRVPAHERMLAPLAALPLDLRMLSRSAPALDRHPECPTFGRHHSHSGLFLGLEAGYFTSDRELGMNDTTAASQWLLNRERSETVLDAWSSQLTIGYQHQRGWRLRAGLALTQLTNVFEWSTEQSTVDTVEGIQRITIAPNGDSTFVRGPIARYQRSTYFKRTYNRMQQWEIPLLLGYRLQQGDWSFVLEAGPRFLLQRQWSGDVLDEDTNITSWEEALDYRSTIGLQSVDLGAQVSYRLGEQLDLGLGLWGRFPMQDYGLEGASQRERYQLLGAQIGLFYRL